MTDRGYDPGRTTAATAAIAAMPPMRAATTWGDLPWLAPYRPAVGTILVAGATGALGRAVVAELVGRAAPVAALARRPAVIAGAEVRAADPLRGVGLDLGW